MIIENKGIEACYVPLTLDWMIVTMAVVTAAVVRGMQEKKKLNSRFQIFFFYNGLENYQGS